MTHNHSLLDTRCKSTIYRYRVPVKSDAPARRHGRSLVVTGVTGVTGVTRYDSDGATPDAAAVCPTSTAGHDLGGLARLSSRAAGQWSGRAVRTGPRPGRGCGSGSMQQGMKVPFGFLNPVLYKLAGTSALHDVLPLTATSPSLYGGESCDIAICGVQALTIFDVQSTNMSARIRRAGHTEGLRQHVRPGHSGRTVLHQGPASAGELTPRPPGQTGHNSRHAQIGLALRSWSRELTWAP